MQIPAVGSHLVVTVPAPKTLLVRLNRPEQLNSMDDALEKDIERVLDWAEEEPSIWVIVITGTGKVFCAGQNLTGWLANSKAKVNQGQRILANKNGFGSIARRESKKVYICALNGSSYGGGSELLVNCDIVIGIEGRAVVFPEVRRGVVAGVGGIPNAYLRSPMLMPYIYAGLPIPEHLLKAHIYTETVKTPDEVLPAALAWAASIVECSPEAVWVSKHQVNLYKAAAIQQVITNSVATPESIQLYDGANLKEGLLAFVEKRATAWTDPPRVAKAKL